MISVQKGAILKNVVATRQPVTIIGESGSVGESDCKKIIIYSHLEIYTKKENNTTFFASHEVK
jgi:hypothetical protein